MKYDMLTLYVEFAFIVKLVIYKYLVQTPLILQSRTD